MCFALPSEMVRKPITRTFTYGFVFTHKQNIPLSGYYLFGIKGVTARDALPPFFCLFLGKVFKGATVFIQALRYGCVGIRSSCPLRLQRSERNETSPVLSVPLALCVIAEIIGPCSRILKEALTQLYSGFLPQVFRRRCLFPRNGAENVSRSVCVRAAA